MSRNLHVACSPLTNTIYAGSVSKCGQKWLSDRTDVTNEALAAVAQHIGPGFTVTLSEGGKPTYEIEVRAAPGIEARQGQDPQELGAIAREPADAVGAPVLDPLPDQGGKP